MTASGSVSNYTDPHPWCPYTWMVVEEAATKLPYLQLLLGWADDSPAGRFFPPMSVTRFTRELAAWEPKHLRDAVEYWMYGTVTQQEHNKFKIFIITY